MPCSSERDEIKNSQGRIVAPDENPLMTIATRVQKNENAVDTYLSIQRKPADYRSFILNLPFRIFLKPTF